jgi:2-polyprenyl-3-methyl-5-hydroxy-6-metoxy-1,4-benzoquinol methylase
MKCRELTSKEEYVNLQNARSSIDICHAKLQNIKHLLSSKDDYILDIGHRNGGLLNECNVNGYKNVFGFDIGELSFELVSKKYPYLVSDNRIKKHDAHEGIPFDEKFDVIVLSHVLEHMHDTTKVLNNIRDSLKDGGSVYVVVPKEKNMDHLPHYTIFEKSEDLKNLMAENGFKEVRDTKCGSNRNGMSEIVGSFQLDD